MEAVFIVFVKRLFNFILPIILLLVLSSCVSEKNTQQAKTNEPAKITPKAETLKGKLIEPGMLISMEEAEKFTGSLMKDAEKTENKVVGQKICFYNPKNEDSRFLQISIQQKAFMSKSLLDAGETPKTIYETTKKNFEKAVQVDGIGDDAFIAPPGIHILKGEYYITVGVGNSDDETNRGILKEVGKKAVENLEKALQ